jgi:hypothetical protein
VLTFHNNQPSFALYQASTEGILGGKCIVCLNSLILPIRVLNTDNKTAQYLFDSYNYVKKLTKNPGASVTVVPEKGRSGRNLVDRQISKSLNYTPILVVRSTEMLLNL